MRDPGRGVNQVILFYLGTFRSTSRSRTNHSVQHGSHEHHRCTNPKFGIPFTTKPPNTKTQANGLANGQNKVRRDGRYGLETKYQVSISQSVNYIGIAASREGKRGLTEVSWFTPVVHINWDTKFAASAR